MTDSKKKTRTGKLFKEPPSGYGSARDLRVLYSLMSSKDAFVTLANMVEDTGLSRTTVIQVVRLLQESFPTGYGMEIKSSINGYQVLDTGIFDSKKLDLLIQSTTPPV